MAVNGKTALITGASGNLGQALVTQFLDAGYAVYGVYHRSEPGETHPKLHWITTEGIEDLAEKTPIDVCVHAAGGFRYAPIDQTSNEDVEFLMNANLKSAFYITRAILPGMKSRNFGRIVFISSKSIEAPAAGMSVYLATKAGLATFAQAVQNEVKDLNININTLLPSVIDTPINRRDMPQADFSAWVTPKALAERIHKLVSESGNSIRGANIQV